MEVAIAVVIVAVIAIGVGVSLGVRKRRRLANTAAATPPPAPPRDPRPEPAPMTGLEDALSQVTDRSGTTMRDRLDAESGHVDELRVTDDTGPLLRRALDHVEPATPDDSPADADVADGADGPGDEQT